MMRNKKLIGVMILAFAGILSIAVGIYRGEVNEVFKKAIKICLECIGIG